MDFTPITTQEQFDSAIGERLKRERETLSKKYADYDELKAKVTDYEKQVSSLTKELEKGTELKQTIADLQSQVHKYETDSVKTRVALELGLPYGMASRLTGTNEEEIRKDAESLKELVGTRTVAPVQNTEPATGDNKTAALRGMLQHMKG